MPRVSLRRVVREICASTPAVPAHDRRVEVCIRSRTPAGPVSAGFAAAAPGGGANASRPGARARRPRRERHLTAGPRPAGSCCTWPSSSGSGDAADGLEHDAAADPRRRPWAHDPFDEHFVPEQRRVELGADVGLDAEVLQLASILREPARHRRRVAHDRAAHEVAVIRGRLGRAGRGAFFFFFFFFFFFRARGTRSSP